MKVILVANSKGGAGKTTLSRHLGEGLSKMGSNVLFVDADPQGTLTRWILGTEPSAGLDELLLADYGDGALLEDVIQPVDNGNSILPAGTRLGQAYKMLDALAQHRLREAIDAIELSLDYVIIDAPPRDGTEAQTLLMASDYVLYALDGDPESLTSLQKLHKEVTRVQKHHPSLKVLGSVVTKARKSSALRDVEAVVAELYAGAPVQTQIPQSNYFPNLSVDHETIFDVAERQIRAQRLVAAYAETAAAVQEAVR